MTDVLANDTAPEDSQGSERSEGCVSRCDVPVAGTALAAGRRS